MVSILSAIRSVIGLLASYFRSMTTGPFGSPLLIDCITNLSIALPIRQSRGSDATA